MREFRPQVTVCGPTRDIKPDQVHVVVQEVIVVLRWDVQNQPSSRLPQSIGYFRVLMTEHITRRKSLATLLFDTWARWRNMRLSHLVSLAGVFFFVISYLAQDKNIRGPLPTRTRPATSSAEKLV